MSSLNPLPPELTRLDYLAAIVGGNITADQVEPGAVLVPLSNGKTLKLSRDALNTMSTQELVAYMKVMGVRFTKDPDKVFPDLEPEYLPTDMTGLGLKSPFSELVEKWYIPEGDFAYGS